MKTLSEKVQKLDSQRIEKVAADLVKAGTASLNESSKSDDTVDGGTLDEIVVTPDRGRGHNME